MHGAGASERDATPSFAPSHELPHHSDPGAFTRPAWSCGVSLTAPCDFAAGAVGTGITACARTGLLDLTGQQRMDADWDADLKRSAMGRSAWREQSLWALWVYRFGRRVDAKAPGWRRTLQLRVYRVLFTIVETATGISLPKEVQIGPGLRIWHFGGIFVNPETVIGAGCTLRQGVTLGNRVEGGPCPIVEDRVEIGAYAQVLGGVRLGHDCRIGAMAVVLRDVPAGCTAVGNPARLLSKTPGIETPLESVSCEGAGLYE